MAFGTPGHDDHLLPDPQPVHLGAGAVDDQRQIERAENVPYGCPRSFKAALTPGSDSNVNVSQSA
jgi:hypothetical protein